MTKLRPGKPRLLIAHARVEAFMPGTVSILAKLGYQIVFDHHLDETAEIAADEPALRVVDERQLAEVPEAEGRADTPILLLTGRHGVSGADPRIVAALQRPTGLHDLYCVLQQLFEDYPRATPRVPVHIRAHCRSGGREWGGALLSLSESGCLLRSGEPLPLGSDIDLRFELPGAGALEVRAESAYQIVPDAGLVFSALEPAAREVLRRYVVAALSGA